MTQRLVVRLQHGRQSRTIRVFGTQLTESYGYGPGTPPRHAREYFDTEAQAKTAFESRLAQRLKNKFELLGRDDTEVPRPAPHVEAASPELEAACLRAAAGDEGPWRVYADWLQAQGDVRGQLAALVQAGRREEVDARLSEDDAAALFGDLAKHIDLEVYDWSWAHGFWSGVSLKRQNFDSKTNLADLTRGVLALPVTRFVHSLRFGLASYESDNDWSATLKAVTESSHAAALSSLRFDDYTSDDCELSWTAYGDFSFAWPHLPALEVLELRAGQPGTLGACDLPKLKRFVRESGGLARSELEEISKAQWPNLEFLEVWFGAAEYGAEGSAAALEAWLTGEKWPKLQHLGLVNCEFAPDLVEVVAKSKLLGRLSSVDFSHSMLGPEHVALFAQHRAAFARLQAVNVSNNYFDADSLAALKEALPNVVSTEQRTSHGGGDNRYVAAGE